MGPKGNCFNRQKVKRRRHFFYFWIRGRMSASRRHISGFCCTLEEAQIANLDKSTVCGKFVYSCDHIFVGRCVDVRYTRSSYMGAHIDRWFANSKSGRVTSLKLLFNRYLDMILILLAFLLFLGDMSKNGRVMLGACRHVIKPPRMAECRMHRIHALSSIVYSSGYVTMAMLVPSSC